MSLRRTHPSAQEPGSTPAPRARPGTVLACLLDNPQGPGLDIAKGPISDPCELPRRKLLMWGARVARLLQGHAVEAGDRVAIILPTCPEFLAALLGIWGNRAAVVPVAHHRTERVEEPWLARLRSILTAARPRLVISAESVLSERAAEVLKQCGVPVIWIEELQQAVAEGNSHAYRLPHPDEPALIQFTSGTTANPKGALVRHRQIVDNARQIAMAAHIVGSDRVLSWLPLYHDMGFIGGFLAPIVWNTPVRLMPTETFLANPASWLAALTDFSATIAVVPPFALSLATRLPKSRLKGVSLAALRYIWVGAEPIFPAALRDFETTFRPLGLRDRALKPCYGLAEATLCVSTTPPGESWKSIIVSPQLLHEQNRFVRCEQGLEIVCSGVPVADTDVKIVDDEGNRVPDGIQGHVRVRGPGVIDGYYGGISAREGEWLVTGDLGCLLERRLYITGRVKDIIKRGGVTYHPQEIESVINGIAGVRDGHVAAFSVLGAREEIVVMAETRVSEVQRETLQQAILQAAASGAGVQVDHVWLVPPGTIPRTSSGKMQRNACRSLFGSKDSTTSG
ncbi:MAG: AMP-binding protein [Candidatus Xenobia bacterium]